MLWRRRPPNPLTALGPLYHSYKVFGVDNRQLRGAAYRVNQKVKSPVIAGYIQLAIAKARVAVSDTVSFTELFCADGFYALLARHFGADSSVGVDNDRDGHMGKAPLIAQALNIDKCSFLKMDAANFNSLPQTDVVANLGGLYHVEDPESVLRDSYALARKYLIVQTVVSLATDDPTYYAAPAPGWTWGNRYSRQSFEALIRSTGWRVIDSHFNILLGNKRLEDRGSVYFLIEKDF